jgi:transposase
MWTVRNRRLRLHLSTVLWYDVYHIAKKGGAAVAINQTVCDVREVDYLLPSTPCDRCQQPAPRFSTATRVAIDLHLDHPVLLAIMISVHHCSACKHYFRARPPFLRPEAIYTNQVVNKAIAAVYQDGMAMRCVPARLARDFWVVPCEGSVRRWCRDYQGRFDWTDYQTWVVREFSGILCVDEVYQHQLALLLAVDPAAPNGDRLVGYQLVHGPVDAPLVEAFLTRLRQAGVQPEEVITDGSELYPAVLARVWPTAAHQLCLFHEARRVTSAAMEVVQEVRKTLPTPPPQASWSWKGPLRDHPPTADPHDPAYQRWQFRQAIRQAGIAQVHALAAQKLSKRAIARQLGLHRQTVRNWLQKPPPSEVDPELADNWRQRTMPDATTMRREQRQAKWDQVQDLSRQNLSYSAIARQVGVHRITVKLWVEQGRLQAQAGPAPALAETGPDTTANPTDRSVDALPLAVPDETKPDPAPPETPAASPPAPPAPWTTWEQVQQVREALQEHRFLFLYRPEHLDTEQHKQLQALLDSPAGPQLRVARGFLEDWYQLWTDEQGHRRSWEEACQRFVRWRADPTYAAVPALRRIQDRMTDARFEKLSQFLRHPHWEATNNGAERGGRAFRHLQGPHFNLRQQETINGALMVTACQRQLAATSPPTRQANRCRCGRRPRSEPATVVAGPRTAG